MKVMGARQWTELHNMSPWRVRRLLREERVFPYQRLENGYYVLYQNTVVVPPCERPNRKARKDQMLTTPHL